MNDLFESALDLLEAIVGATPRTIGGLERLTNEHRILIFPHLAELRNISRHIVDGRTVQSAHADLIARTNAICAQLRTSPRLVDSFASARFRDYAAKARPELEHEAALIVRAPGAELGQPSQDRQNDILTTIRNANMPLQRPELIERMGLVTKGSLGRNLEWMVRRQILINIPNRGYWPEADPIPV